MSRTKRKVCEEYKDSVFDTTRDKKKWYKPNKEFKKLRRRSERAKIKSKLNNGNEEDIITYKRSDEWDWN